MLEKDIENLIARYPEEFFPNSGFKLTGQQVNLGGCRADLIFKDKHNRKIIIEVKRGLLTREASGQIMEYYGLLKQQDPNQIIELILCANIIPNERKIFLENVGIECKELGVPLILNIAQKYDYKFIDDNGNKKKEIHQEQQKPVLIKDDINLEKSESNVWIFQGNPKRYKIIEDLSDKTLKGWRVKQYRNKIKKGDIALIWISGESAGIYAIADIISNPEYMPCTPEEENKCIDKEMAKGEIAVKLNFIKYLLDSPIYRFELKNSPGLEHLSIFGFKNATNYPVRKEEWEVIKQKIK
jgi:hypothetical protein